ncbi:Uncharacterized protein HZ326_12486 [Fusarium oxysporum f. sp. albedinis]|nr:Uncharacterized protein HZ326_12486 [Fusarium oxysporum f. sp. albedinis]
MEMQTASGKPSSTSAHQSFRFCRDKPTAIEFVQTDAMHSRKHGVLSESPAESNCPSQIRDLVNTRELPLQTD